MSKTDPKITGKEPGPKTPADLRLALKAAPLVEAVWQSLTPLARWDFIIWINQTKEPETRKRRISKAVSILSAGKRRPCCFTIIPAELYRAFGTNPRAKAKWENLGPVERRNLVSWIDSTRQSSTSKTRAQKACVLLAAGKHRP